MKTTFWTVITLILALTLLSLALYSGEPEEISEPVPENAAVKITELREAVDEMGALTVKLNEITALAVAYGRSQQANEWITEAENIEASIQAIFTETVLALSQSVLNMEIPEASVKQVNEFTARARGYVSLEARRNFLLEKRKAGVRASSNTWLTLADLYSKNTDTYDANAGLTALGKLVTEFDRNTGGRILDMVSDPYFKALNDAGSAAPGNAAGFGSGITDPYLRLNALIQYGWHHMGTDVTTELKKLIDTFEDNNEKAFLAARILMKLPNMSSAQREQFFAEINKADDPLVLLAETKMTLVENGGADGALREDYLNDLAALITDIPQNFARERLYARKLMCQTDNFDIHDIAEMADGLHSVTLKEQVLTHYVLNKAELSDDEFEEIVGHMHDAYSKLIVSMDRFRKSDLGGYKAQLFLDPLAGAAGEIDELQPRLDLLVLWAEVDPFIARQKLIGFNTEEKVYTAIRLFDVLIPEGGSFSVDASQPFVLIANDVYKELSDSRQFEPIEQAALLRQLGAAVKTFDRSLAEFMMQEAYALID